MTWIYTKTNQNLSSNSKYGNASVLVENPSRIQNQTGGKVSASSGIREMAGFLNNRVPGYFMANANPFILRGCLRFCIWIFPIDLALSQCRSSFNEELLDPFIPKINQLQVSPTAS